MLPTATRDYHFVHLLTTKRRMMPLNEVMIGPNGPFKCDLCHGCCDLVQWTPAHPHCYTLVPQQPRPFQDKARAHALVDVLVLFFFIPKSNWMRRRQAEVN